MPSMAIQKNNADFQSRSLVKPGIQKANKAVQTTSPEPVLSACPVVSYTWPDDMGASVRPFATRDQYGRQGSTDADYRIAMIFMY